MINAHFDRKEARLDAIERNVEWLREHDLDHQEAPVRLGLIQGDVDALLRLSGVSVND